eukprot:5467093-Prymnesium_polylepis.2
MGREGCAHDNLVHGLQGPKTTCLPPQPAYVAHLDDGCTTDSFRCIVTYAAPTIPTCDCTALANGAYKGMPNGLCQKNDATGTTTCFERNCEGSKLIGGWEYFGCLEDSFRCKHRTQKEESQPDSYSLCCLQPAVTLCVATTQPTTCAARPDRTARSWAREGGWMHAPVSAAIARCPCRRWLGERSSASVNSRLGEREEHARQTDAGLADVRARRCVCLLVGFLVVVAVAFRSVWHPPTEESSVRESYVNR